MCEEMKGRDAYFYRSDEERVVFLRHACRVITRRSNSDASARFYDGVLNEASERGQMPCGRSRRLHDWHECDCEQ